METKKEPQLLAQHMANATGRQFRSSGHRAGTRVTSDAYGQTDEWHVWARAAVRCYEPLWEDELEMLQLYIVADADFAEMATFNAEGYVKAIERKRRAMEQFAESLVSARKKSEYWKGVADAEKAAEANRKECSMEWFLGQLEVHQCRNLVKITHHHDMVADFLMAAYRKRVTNDMREFDNDEDTRMVVADVAKWMTVGKKNGIILRGYIGVGKSTMMRAIMDVFQILEQKSIVEVSAKEVADAGKDDRKRFQELCDMPMLAIDDLGTEPAVLNQYKNEITPIVDLLTQRHRRLLFTIITTNLIVEDGKDEIEGRYGNRVCDRVGQLCSSITYRGDKESYRTRR